MQIKITHQDLVAMGIRERSWVATLEEVTSTAKSADGRHWEWDPISQMWVHQTDLV